MPVSQLTGRSRTAALAVRGRDPAPGEADRADPDCARAGLPRSRHRPRGGEPAGQAEDSINGYRRSGARGLWSLGEGTMASGEPGDARTRVRGNGRERVARDARQ